MSASPQYRPSSGSRPRSSMRSSRSRGSTTEMRVALVAPMEEARFTASVLHEAGASVVHARLVASALAAADVRGKYSFGLLTLPVLLRALSQGTLNPRFSPQLVNDAPTLAWVEGGNAFGPVVGHFCMNLALNKARSHGIGVVFCHSTTDMGFPGWYTSMALKKNMIGLCFSSVHDNLISATEAASGETKLGLNRLSASAPSLDSNNFELQMSWRLELPPQTMTPRLPAELRSSTSSELVLNEVARPPPGACGHDPRKGFLAALVVEGLCGFLGGMHYKGQPRAPEEKPFYVSFPLMSELEDFKGATDERPRDSEDNKDSPGIENVESLNTSLEPSQQLSNPETISGQPSSQDTPEEWKVSSVPATDSPSPDEDSFAPESNIREIDCRAPPPPDVRVVNECSCAEDKPKKTPPPGEQLVVCVPPEKFAATPKPAPAISKHVALTPSITTIPEEEIPSSETDEIGVPEQSSEQDAASHQEKPEEKTGPETVDKTTSEEKQDRNANVRSSMDEGQADEEGVEGTEAAHCFIAIDPEAVEPGFSRRLGGFLRHMASQEPLDPARPILIPGDPERMCILRAQRQGGVRFMAEDIKRINLLAQRMGVDPMVFIPDLEYAWWRSDI